MANIKSYIAGFITGVVFPTIAGLIIFQLTEGKNIGTLTYWANSPVYFSGETVKLTTRSIIVANRGNAASEDVVVAIKFDNNVKIQDSKIEFSSGDAASYTSLPLPSGEEGTRINIPALAPDETITFTYLIEGTDSRPPYINVKSSNNIGKYDIQALIERDDNPSDITKHASVLTIIFGGVAGSIYAFALWRILVRKISTAPNNTAFLLLHQELYTEAQKILENELANRGPGLYELCNLAVCAAMTGRQDVAEKYINAAKYLISHFGFTSQSEEGFLLFCEALIVIPSNTSLALEHLRKAVSKSKSIQEYIKYSLLIERLRNSSPSIDAVFKQIQV